jgi:hypothetical protein
VDRPPAGGRPPQRSGYGRGGPSRPHGPGRGSGRAGGPGRRSGPHHVPRLSPEEKTKATDVATRSGIPFPRAVMVIRGQAKLNDVLQDLFQQQKRERLVRDGLDRSLAGQVANGRLDAARAKRIQAVWKAQDASFHSDRLAALAGKTVVLCTYGPEVVHGRLTRVGRYDLVLEPGDGAAARVLKKHDVKAYCRAEDGPALAKALGEDPEVAALALGPSTALDERWRPDEDLALKWAAEHPVLQFRFRDGQTLAGRPVRVALYEIEVACGDARACILTHALLKDRPFEAG